MSKPTEPTFELMCKRCGWPEGDPIHRNASLMKAWGHDFDPPEPATLDTELMADRAEEDAEGRCCNCGGTPDHNPDTCDDGSLCNEMGCSLMVGHKGLCMDSDGNDFEPARAEDVCRVCGVYLCIVHDAPAAAPQAGAGGERLSERIANCAARQRDRDSAGNPPLVSVLRLPTFHLEMWSSDARALETENEQLKGRIADAAGMLYDKDFAK